MTGLQGLAQEASGGPVRGPATPTPASFRALRDTRTEIGKQLSDPAAVGTANPLNKRSLDMIYGARGH